MLTCYLLNATLQGPWRP